MSIPNQSESVHIKNNEIFPRHLMKKLPTNKGQIKLLQKNKSNQQDMEQNKKIKSLAIFEYDNNQFMIQPRSIKQVNCRYNFNGKQIINDNLKNTFNIKSHQQQQTPSPCLGLINPMYINLKSNPKRFVSSTNVNKQKNNNQNNANNNSTNSNSEQINTKNIIKPFIKKIQTKNCIVNNIQANKQFLPNGSRISYKTNDNLVSHKSQSLYSKIVSQMNDYFNSMKLASFKNNRVSTYSSKQKIRQKNSLKTKVQRQKRSGSINMLQLNNMNKQQNYIYQPKGYNSRKQYYNQHNQVVLNQNNNKNAQNQDNFNVISLRPRHSAYKKVNRNLFNNNNNNNEIRQYNNLEQSQSLLVFSSQQLVGSPYTNKGQEIIKFDSIGQSQSGKSQKTNSLIINNNIFSSQMKRVQKSLLGHRPFTHNVSTTSHKKKIISITLPLNGYCFGDISNPRLNQQQVYKLKILYYKDFIWKNSFNIGLKFQYNISLNNNNNKNGQNQTIQELRYFVGKGNNSKLIKRLMSKRWWWQLDSKQQSASFVWTQLKIYSIYQKQQQYQGIKINKSNHQIIKQSHHQNIKQSHRSNISKSKNQNISKSNNQNISKSNHQTINKQNHESIQNIQNQQVSDDHNPQQNSEYKKQQIYKKPNDNSQMLFNKERNELWINYISYKQNSQRQKKLTQQKLQVVRQKLLKRVQDHKTLQVPKKITNHLQFSKVIGNKKALYKVMMLYFNKIKKYSPDQIYVPLTFHITAGLEDQQYLKFLSEYYRRNKNDNKTCWIVKPGEMTNRGKGIQYCRDLNQIKPIVKQKQTHPNGTLKTFLIQQYLDRPLLYRGRKFDIRHYIMFTSTNGYIRGYFYQQGYIRTTSYKYRLNDNSPSIHLTNDAVQKYCKDYGKYQKGNKLSYEQFDKYLQQNNKSISFYNNILPQIRNISKDISQAAYYFVDPKRKINNFQIFGLDIMIDQNYKCYLIQVNTNPCLQLSSPVLQKVIPDMLDNALTLTIDTCYPPPQNITHYHKKFNYPLSVDNKFQLVFDQQKDSKNIQKLYQSQNNREMMIVGDDDQNFESCDDDDDY